MKEIIEQLKINFKNIIFIDFNLSYSIGKFDYVDFTLSYLRSTTLDNFDYILDVLHSKASWENDPLEDIIKPHKLYQESIGFAFEENKYDLIYNNINNILIENLDYVKKIICLYDILDNSIKYKILVFYK